MKCWKCGSKQDPLPDNKLPFRATCEKCHAWLHCCRNCKNYQPGLPNDCKIPGTDYIADREAGNFCDEFILSGIPMQKNADIDDVSRRLFGDTGGIKKKSFDDLF